MNNTVSSWFNPDFFRNNRRRFMERMDEGSLAVFHGADMVISNADQFHPYTPSSNFFYFSGIEQPGCILLLHPDNRLGEREILFIPKPDPEKEAWNGPMLTKEETAEVSGVEKVQYTNDFEGKFVVTQESASTLYADYSDEGFRNSTSDNSEFLRKVRTRLPGLHLKKTSTIVTALRRIKSPEEIRAIKKAIEITEKALRALWSEVKPDRWEYQLEAVLMYHFIWNGARRTAYDPIVASGLNATVLHYIENNQQLETGDMLLTDVGASFLHYSADITRTVPVNGQFTSRQSDVYQAVLNVQKEIIEQVKPDVHMDYLNEKARNLLAQALIDLELIADKDDVEKYYMHRIGHFLGLDIHDVGTYSETLTPACVLTVEPGIYIPEEKLGIRIEDNILVTEDGYENLSASIPKEIDEIESALG